MPQVADVMTRQIRTLAPQDSIVLAAQAMDELNVGAIPVCEGERLVGMVTDRDITVRGVAQNRPLDEACVSDVMSAHVRSCFEDQSLDDVLHEMRSAQIRRLPVLDRQQRVVGIVSLGDVAVKASSQHAGQALEAISEPAEPDRSGFSAASGAAGGGSASGVASRSPG